MTVFGQRGIAGRRRGFLMKVSACGILVRRASWLAAGLTCLLYAGLVTGRIGLHLDDYLQKVLATDEHTHQSSGFFSLRRIHTYPVRVLALASAVGLCDGIPKHAWLVRLVMTSLLGLNAFLLGGLVYQLTESWVAGVVAGWLFLAPVWAFEVVFWASGWFYVPMTTGTLAFLHVCRMAIQTRSRRRFGFCLLAVAGVLALTIGFGEAPLSSVGVVPGLALALWARSPGVRFRAALARCAALVALSLLVVADAYELLYARSWVLNARGPIVVEPSTLAERCTEYAERTYWMTMSATWGRPLLRELWQAGLANLQTHPTAAVLLGLVVVAVFATVLSSPRAADRAAPSVAASAVVLLTGVAWCVAGVLLPGILISGQIVEYRMLYYPIAGLCVAVGAVVACLDRWGARLHRVVLLAGGAAMVGNATLALGMGSAYSARAQRNTRQLDAFAAAFAPESLPPDTVLVPFSTDETFEPQWPHLCKLLPGVYEAPWSASYAVQLRTGQWRAAVVQNRWAGMVFSIGPSDAQRGPTHISIQGQPVPIERALVFTYQGGRILPIGTLHVRLPDGHCEPLDLPLARQVARPAVPSMDVVVQDGVASYQLVRYDGPSSPTGS